MLLIYQNAFARLTVHGLRIKLLLIELMVLRHFIAGCRWAVPASKFLDVGAFKYVLVDFSRTDPKRGLLGRIRLQGLVHLHILVHYLTDASLLSVFLLLLKG